MESESEFQVKSRDPEADAWAVIDALPVEDIFPATKDYSQHPFGSANCVSRLLLFRPLRKIE